MVLKRLWKKKIKPDSCSELNRELELLGSALRAEGRWVQSKNRKTRVYGNYIEFWENGIKWLGIQGIDSIQDMARLVMGWNEQCKCSCEIEKEFPEIKFPESRKKIEEGEEAYLDWFWKKMIGKRDRRFGALINLCAANERTRALMSYIELRDFGLSRSIGLINGINFMDLPRIRITDDWEYEVRTPTMAVQEYAGQAPRQCIGRGDAHEAFRILLDSLPPNLGRAQYQSGAGCCPPAA